MTVKLMWATPNADALISRMARVSAPGNENKPAAAIIQYMIRHGHWSPFEMAAMCVEISAPRDIARQILRHRSFSFQEFSQRYAEPAALPAAEFREARMQDQANRQSSLPCDSEATADWWAHEQARVASTAEFVYRRAISRGIAREVARAVLPEGLTPSRMYMSGSLRSWLHYCDLRMGNGTQLEHQQIAIECFDVLQEVAPLTVAAFEAAQGVA